MVSLRQQGDEPDVSKAGGKKKQKNPLRMFLVVKEGKEYFRNGKKYFRAAPDNFKPKSSVRFSELCELRVSSDTRQLEPGFGVSRGDAGISVPLGSCGEGWVGFFKMSVFSEQSLLKKTVGQLLEMSLYQLVSIKDSDKERKKLLY